jgi:GxxExxY protein
MPVRHVQQSVKSAVIPFKRGHRGPHGETRCMRRCYGDVAEPALRDTCGMDGLLEEATTRAIIGAFYEVYNALGYGFLEHVYVRALERELNTRGLRVGREVAVLINYKGEPLTTQRLDILVNERVVVEVKSGPELPKGAKRQVYSYLRATNLEVGLLLHFGLEARFDRYVKPNGPAPITRPVDEPDNA